MTRIAYTQGPGQWGQLVSQHNSDTGQSHFYGFDHLSNARFLADSGKSVTDSYAYKAFGEQTVSSESNANALRFGGEVGYYRDKLERVYIRARHYSASNGTWLSRDPAGFIEGTNLYSYVSNSPVKRVDPEGLRSKTSPIDPKTGCYTESCCGCNTVPYAEIRKWVERKLKQSNCFTNTKYSKNEVSNVIADVIACLAPAESQRDPHCFTDHKGAWKHTYGLFQLDKTQWHACGGIGPKICDSKKNTKVAIELILTSCHGNTHPGHHVDPHNMFDAIERLFGVFPAAAAFKGCLTARNRNWSAMVKPLLESTTCPKCRPKRSCY